MAHGAAWGLHVQHQGGEQQAKASETSHRLGLRGICDHVNEGEDKAAHAREDLQTQQARVQWATQVGISPGLRWASAPSDQVALHRCHAATRGPCWTLPPLTI